MKAATTKLLVKADRALAAAQALLDHGDPEFAISRAYFGMYYAATGLLHERGLAFRKHTAVHAALAEHFTRTGALDSKYHRWILDAADARNTADYRIEPRAGGQPPGAGAEPGKAPRAIARSPSCGSRTWRFPSARRAERVEPLLQETALGEEA